MTPNVLYEQGMVKHKILNLHFVAHLEFAVLTLNNAITTVAQELHPDLSVWQIGNLDIHACLQISRTDFIVRCIEIRISVIFNLRELVPVGIAQITGNGIEGRGMGTPLVLGKAHKAFKRSSTNMDACLALDVERQEFTI